MLRPSSTRPTLLLPPAAAPTARIAEDEDDDLDEYRMPADSGLPALPLLPLALLPEAPASGAALLQLPVPTALAVLPLALLLPEPYALPAVPASPTVARALPALLGWLGPDAWGVLGADKGRLLPDGGAETCGGASSRSRRCCASATAAEAPAAVGLLPLLKDWRCRGDRPIEPPLTPEMRTWPPALLLLMPLAPAWRYGLDEKHLSGPG